MSTNISTAATAVVVIIAFMFSLVVQAKESDRARSKTRSEVVWEAVFQTAYKTTGNFIAAALSASAAVQADDATRRAAAEVANKG